ncbi:hypothetical protein F5B20DRAFT_110783 [Whalleya microplaca]|nr:hypothetical protein F5B20DRAFT_110783 [Whalleya microplaca]
MSTLNVSHYQGISLLSTFHNLIPSHNILSIDCLSCAVFKAQPTITTAPTTLTIYSLACSLCSPHYHHDHHCHCCRHCRCRRRCLPLSAAITTNVVDTAITTNVVDAAMYGSRRPSRPRSAYPGGPPAGPGATNNGIAAAGEPRAPSAGPSRLAVPGHSGPSAAAAAPGSQHLAEAARVPAMQTVHAWPGWTSRPTASPADLLSTAPRVPYFPDARPSGAAPPASSANPTVPEGVAFPQRTLPAGVRPNGTAPVASSAGPVVPAPVESPANPTVPERDAFPALRPRPARVQDRFVRVGPPLHQRRAITPEPRQRHMVPNLGAHRPRVPLLPAPFPRRVASPSPPPRQRRSIPDVPPSPRRFVPLAPAPPRQLVPLAPAPVPQVAAPAMPPWWYAYLRQAPLPPTTTANPLPTYGFGSAAPVPQLSPPPPPRRPQSRTWQGHLAPVNGVPMAERGHSLPGRPTPLPDADVPAGEEFLAPSLRSVPAMCLTVPSEEEEQEEEEDHEAEEKGEVEEPEAEEGEAEEEEEEEGEEEEDPTLWGI